MVYDPTIPEKFLEQSKKIKQSSRGPRGYDINICVIFCCSGRSFSSGGETGRHPKLGKWRVNLFTLLDVRSRFTCGESNPF